MTGGKLVPADRAALALIDEAERALTEVSTPEQADELWRKVKAVEEAARLARVAESRLTAVTRIRLQARRLWGEWLGKAENRGPATVTHGHGSTAADRKDRERVRLLAALPGELFSARLERKDLAGLAEKPLLDMARELGKLTEPRARQKATAEALARAAENGCTVSLRHVRASVESWAPEPQPVAQAPKAAPSHAQRKLLARLPSDQARTNAWQEACERAERDGRTVADDHVAFAVDLRLPTEDADADSESAQPSSPVRVETPSGPAPAEQFDCLAAFCRGKLVALAGSLSTAGAAQSQPGSIEDWRTSFSAARDALDALIEELAAAQAGIEAATPAEEAEAERLAAKFEGLAR
jgi:hypothetical protein